MATTSVKKLHWTQRMALVRYNLHSACRSGNFGFFKGLQVADLMEGTNHTATLSSILGNEADGTLTALNNANAGLALAHEKAFETVYENLKNLLRDDEAQDVASKVRVDVATQRDITDLTIDKLFNTAIAIIDQVAAEAQDEAANAWITGTTITADSIEVAIQEMSFLGTNIDDFIQLEDSRNIVKASVASAVTGLRGIFSLMEPSDSQNEKPSRTMSIVSVSNSMFRRVSNAFQSSGRSYAGSTPASPTSPTTPFSPFLKSTHSNADHGRNNWNFGESTDEPSQTGFSFHRLSNIPATPKCEETDPFDTSQSPPVPELPPQIVGEQGAGIATAI